MNEHLILTILEEAPFSLQVMIQFIIVSFFIMPLFSFIFLCSAIYKRIRKKNFLKSVYAAFLSMFIFIFGYYIVSTKYISTEITSFFIGENNQDDAKRHSVIGLKTLSKLSDAEKDELNKCNTPYQKDGKYISPRLFEIAQCLGLK